jgi:hypothetical protein
MNPQASSPSSTGATLIAAGHEKCRHFTARGRQCRLPALRSGLCFRHAALELQPLQPVDVDLSADFLIQLDDLRSAGQINQFLAKLLILVVQNRISARRAAVLAYITNQLLRTLPAIDRELNPKEDPNAPAEIIFDAPRPDRTEQSEPQLTCADVHA